MASHDAIHPFRWCAYNPQVPMTCQTAMVDMSSTGRGWSEALSYSVQVRVLLDQTQMSCKARQGACNVLP
jgi:hypothetical protein